MTAAGYVPFKGSLAEKALAFFEANPDEKLTADDIAAKFECNRASVHTCLVKCVDLRYLARDKNADGEQIYSLGTMAPARIRALRAEPLGEVKIDNDVPIPAQRSGRGTEHATLLKALASLDVGQSFALPIGKRATLQKALGEANKVPEREYTSRIIGDDKVRAWRVA